MLWNDFKLSSLREDSCVLGGVKSSSQETHLKKNFCLKRKFLMKNQNGEFGDLKHSGQTFPFILALFKGFLLV